MSIEIGLIIGYILLKHDLQISSIREDKINTLQLKSLSTSYNYFEFFIKSKSYKSMFANKQTSSNMLLGVDSD
jgi:hypothetical protein